MGCKFVESILKKGYYPPKRKQNKVLEKEDTRMSEVELKKRSDMAKVLNCANEEECAEINKRLKSLNLSCVPIDPDGSCMFSAVVKPFEEEKNFTAWDMRCSVVYALLHFIEMKDECNVSKQWYDLLRQECREQGISVMEYIYSLYAGDQWGDGILLDLISLIHELQIVIITPAGETTIGDQFANVVHIIYVHEQYSATKSDAMNDVVENEVTSTTPAKESATFSVFDKGGTECDTACVDISEVTLSKILSQETVYVTTASEKTPEAIPCGVLAIQENVYTTTVEDKFAYKFCTRVFANCRTARGHYENKHATEFKFPCEYCDKKFNFRTQFELHQNIHTKVKLYECQFCGKKFNTNGNRNRHKHTCVKQGCK